MEKQLEKAVLKAQEGDVDAFRHIFDELVNRLYQYALAQLKDPAAADDITQDTFIDIWESLGRFEYRSDIEFTGLAFKILKRKVWRYRIVRMRTVSLDETNVTDHYELDPEDYRHLEKGVKKLPKTLRDVVTLRYWSGLSFKEIAATLSITESAAKVRHHRAIKQLEDVGKKYQYAT